MKKSVTAIELFMFLLALVAVAFGARAGHVLFVIAALIFGGYAVSVAIWLLKRR